MSEQEAKKLLAKYEEGNCTDVEKALIERWLFQLNPEPAGWSDERIKAIRQEVWQRLPQQRQIRWWPRVAAAASVLLCLSFGYYFYFRSNDPKDVARKYDVLPGHSQATLTLANGTKIILTRGLTGKLALQGQTSIQANGTEGVIYTTTNPGRNAAISYNTLTTAKGEQSPYPLILADGTKIWLNAESSITFPTAFGAGERLITMKGEAYFEVRHQPMQPFRVKVKNQLIEDIGTHFDVNAYDDESLMKTTLLEGSVKVSNQNGNSKVLKPGQQSISNDTGMEVREVEPGYEVAWKDGFFMFNGASLESIMSKISRWYNMEVVFEDASLKSESFIGTISRFGKLSKALDLLQRTDVAVFEIVQNKIIIKRKAK